MRPKACAARRSGMGSGPVGFRSPWIDNSVGRGSERRAMICSKSERPRCFLEALDWLDEDLLPELGLCCSRLFHKGQ